MQAFPSLWLPRRERRGRWVRQGAGRIKGGHSLVQERGPTVWPWKTVPEKGSQGLGNRPPHLGYCKEAGWSEKVREARAGEKAAFWCAGESGTGGTHSWLPATRTWPASHCPDSAVRLTSRLPTLGLAAPSPGEHWEGTGKDSSLRNAALWRLLPPVLGSQERLHPGFGGGSSYTCALPRLPGGPLAE